MEVFKWMALPETQKAISVCHIQAVRQRWAAWRFLWDNVLRDAPQHFAKPSKKPTRIAEKPQCSGFQRKWCQISSAWCVEMTKLHCCSWENEPLLHSIILFLMGWLRQFYQKMWASDYWIALNQLWKFCLEARKKKKQAHDVHSRTLRRWRTLQILRLSEGRLCFVLFEGAALWYLVIRPWMLTHPCFNTVTGTRRWFMEL